MTRKGDWIQTYKGIEFYPLDPRAEEIDIRDIAHALSMQCRYGGHTKKFYSVAEHCVNLHDYAMEQGRYDILFSVLMHDAAEAYLVDVPRPIKRNLTEYRGIEMGLEKVIFAKWDAPEHPLPFPVPADAMILDTRILTDERKVLMAAPPIPWTGELEELGITIHGWSPARAKKEFLKRFAMHTTKTIQLLQMDDHLS